MVVTLGQQYNIGEKPTVRLYTFINRHAGIQKKTVGDFDVLSFYLAIHEEFLRQYLVPSRGAVWGTRLSR